MKFPVVTYIIIVSCLLIFFTESLFGQNTYNDFELFYWESARSQWWQYFSHLFLHGGIWHLLLNMLCLWMFGTVVESIVGSIKYAIFYVLCGLGAAAAYQVVTYYEFQAIVTALVEVGFNQQELLQAFNQNKYSPQFPASREALEMFITPVVGASGALYGVLVAFACLRPNHKMIFLLLPYPVAAKYFIPALLSIDIIAGFSGYPILGQNIAHAAHIGGALTGLLFMLFGFFISRIYKLL